MATFIISGSFHGPLLDLRHPPSVEQVHDPPKKSGNWLKEEKNKQWLKRDHKVNSRKGKNDQITNRPRINDLQ